MDDKNWRVPTKEEKKQVLFWINKYRKNIGIGGVIASFGLFLAFIIITVVVSIIVHKFLLSFIIIFFIFYLSLICGITVISLLSWNEVYKMVSMGKYMINDATIIEYPYLMQIMHVSYFENDELKRKMFTSNYCSELRNSNVGDKGYIINIKFNKRKKITKIISNYFFVPGKDSINPKEWEKQYKL
ncbi:MAG: hypothetical protein IKS60_03470 [Lachnospiraceae bacterium]|nr:hypothetical protein [Lachnospiraceae bacterium]